MPLLPPRPATKTSLFRSFLVVMFSASKVGGSRCRTSSFFRAGTPSYTLSKRSSPASFFVPRRVLSEMQAATVYTPLPRAVILGNPVSGNQGSRKSSLSCVVLRVRRRRLATQDYLPLPL